MTDQATQKEEFKNENMTVAVSRKPGCHVKFDVEVTPLGIQAAHSQAVRNVKKEISIPGFRKGKAPDNLVQQHYKSHIDQEFRDCVLQTSFNEAMKLTKIYPLNENSVKKPQLKSCSKEDGAKLSIEFESEPQVPQVKPAEFQLKRREKKAITDKNVEETIQNIRHHHAVWEDVTDRPIQEGDFVDLDVDAIDNPAHNICTNTRFEVKKGHMAEWMKNLVIGKNLNETVEGMSEKQEDDHVHTEHCKHESHQHPEFKPTLCRITVKTIKKATLPEINDELAKKVGLQSADELQHRVRDDLEKRAEAEVQEDLRDQMEKLIVEKYSFDVPASLLDGEYNARLANKLKGLRKHNEPEESINSRMSEIEEEVRKEAHEGLQLFFISRKVADEHKIAVTQEELMRELNRQLWMLPVEESVIDPNAMGTDEIRSRLYLVVMAEKAKAYLVQQAQIA